MRTVQPGQDSTTGSAGVPQFSENFKGGQAGQNARRQVEIVLEDGGTGTGGFRLFRLDAAFGPKEHDHNARADQADNSPIDLDIGDLSLRRGLTRRRGDRIAIAHPVKLDEEEDADEAQNAQYDDPHDA
jgi:hypothetical protein